MLTVENLFSQLARGMLKNTSAVENTNLGEVIPEYQETMFYLLNEGLRELFTKKILRKLRVKLTWIEDQASYPLMDSGVGSYLETFESDPDFNEALVVKLLSIRTIADETVRILADTNSTGISTPSYNILLVSKETRESYPDGIVVNYQANHDPISEITDVIHVPPGLEYALQLYVCSRYLSEMGGADHMKRGDELRALYMREMGEDTAQNMSSTSDIESDMRFTDRGFV